MNAMIFRWVSCFLLMVSANVRAGAPEIAGVSWGLDNTLEISVIVDASNEDPEFRVVGSSSIEVPQDEWNEITIKGISTVDSIQHILQIEVVDLPMMFYRVILMGKQGPPSSSVVLSEICSSNTNIFADDDGDFSDWIELHNTGNSPVSLGGWMISDKIGFENPWIFPDVSLDPDQFLLIFASGKDRRKVDAPLHTTFRINAEGEALILKDAQGVLVDAIRVGPLQRNTSLGRLGIDRNQWALFEKGFHTPNQPNAPEGQSYVEAPAFSESPGFFNHAVSLKLETLSDQGKVYYSLNGDDPWRNGQEFLNEIQLNQTAVVRCITIQENGARSAEVVGTFFIQEQTSLATISLSAPASHFDINEGYLYGFGEHMFSRRGNVTANFPFSASNAWKDREIPISFEFFEPSGDRGFQQRLGIKIFGGWGSRGYPQKSLAFFARSEYGKGKVRYPLFPDLEIDAFESFVLRNSGNDNQSTHHIHPRIEIKAFGKPRSSGSYFVNGNFTMMRDAMMQRLAKNLNVDRQAYRPVVVYINGAYWGLYNLREKLNEHYVASHHHVDPNQIDLIEGYGSANAGSSSVYQSMRNYMSRRSLASEDRYQHVIENYLDVSSFTDYHLAVLYFQNFDIGNIKQWRDRNDGVFRWMLYDQDYGFHLWKPEVYLPAMRRDFSDYDNMFKFHTNTSGSGNGWPNSSGRTMMLRRMLENDRFRVQFINRCADLLNTDFESETVIGTIQQMAAVIRPEISRHLERWSWSSLLDRNHGSPFDEEDEPLTSELWEENIEGLKQFARERPDKLRQDLASHFGLPSGTYKLTIEVDPPDAGTIRIHSITHRELREGGGVYFNDIPIQCVAEPVKGFQFLHWNNEDETNNSIQLKNITSNTLHLKASFKSTAN